MTYYLDAEYRLHVNQEDGMIPWEDKNGFFNGHTDAFIEGYRVVPEGYTWTRDDGDIFEGLMIAPAVHYEQLALEDTRNILSNVRAETDAIIAELDAALLEVTYQNIIGELE